MSYFCRHPGDAADIMSESIGLSSSHQQIARGEIDIPGQIKTNRGYKVYELIAWHKWVYSSWINSPTLTAQQGWTQGVFGDLWSLHMSLCPLYTVLPPSHDTLLSPPWVWWYTPSGVTWELEKHLASLAPQCVSLSSPPEAPRSSQISSRSAYTSSWTLEQKIFIWGIRILNSLKCLISVY